MKQLSAFLFAVLVSCSLYSQKRGLESITGADDNGSGTVALPAIP